MHDLIKANKLSLIKSCMDIQTFHSKAYFLFGPQLKNQLRNFGSALNRTYYIQRKPYSFASD